MLTIRNTADMARALDSPIDPHLKTLLTLRRDQLTGYEGFDLEDLAHFTIAEPSDHLDNIERGLGFAPLANMVDGTSYGDPDFEPSTEWIADHGSWYELLWILSDDGFGAVLFLSKAEGVEPLLQAFCREFATDALPLPSPPLQTDQENVIDS